MITCRDSRERTLSFASCASLAGLLVLSTSVLYLAKQLVRHLLWFRSSHCPSSTMCSCLRLSTFFSPCGFFLSYIRTINMKAVTFSIQAIDDCDSYGFSAFGSIRSAHLFCLSFFCCSSSVSFFSLSLSARSSPHLMRFVLFILLVKKILFVEFNCVFQPCTSRFYAV